MQSVISAVLISPDTLLSYGLVRLLRSAHYRLAGVAPSLVDFHTPAGKNEPEIVILVLADDTADLAGVVAHVRQRLPSAKIVILSERINPATCAEALRAGAIAYLPRSISKDAFIKFLGLAVAGEVVVSPELLTSLVAAPVGANASKPPLNRESGQPFDEAPSPLSPREVEILGCLVDGDSNKHISRRFEIAETTVKVHVKSILRKINARNRTQAAIWALNRRNRDASQALLENGAGAH